MDSSKVDNAKNRWGWLSWVLQRYQHREDKELGQVLVRVGIMTLVVMYPTWITLNGGHPDWTWMWAAGGYFIFSAGLLVWVGIFTKPSPVRRFVANFFDNAMITAGMLIWGELASFLVTFYFIITSAHGHRFGPKYLFSSMALSVIGFSIVLTYGDYWSKNLILGGGLFAGLIILPLYMNSLQKVLRKAKDDAEAANQAKSNFLATMSHEFRTPLQAVTGMGELLLTTVLNEKQRNYVKTMLSACQNLVVMLNDILDVTKIEAGKLSLAPVDFDLHALLNNAGALLSLDATRKGLRFLVHIDPSTPFLLHGDEQRIRQILINLVGNSVKFTKTGHIEVRVSMVKEDNGVVWIAFSVTDTGTGIPKEVQPLIFKRFEQADNTITREYGGTGLGLAISKDLVEAMGGTISLSSEPGVGSTFSFSLPFTRQKIVETTELLKGNALIVSRDTNFINQLREYLSGWGLSCRVLDDISSLSVADIVGEGSYTSVLVDEQSLSSVQEFAYEVGRLDTHARQSIVLIRRHVAPANASLLAKGLSWILSLPLDKRQVFNCVHAAQTDHQGLEGVVPLTRAGAQETKKISLSVLVADDTAVNRELLQEVLQRAGHRPYVCSDGDEAIDALVDYDFDLLICDLHMPGRSGIDVFEAYRAMDPLGEAIPAILLTADVTPQARRLCQDAGFDMLLAKPIKPHELIQAIDQVIEQRSTGVRIERRKKPRQEKDNGILDYSYLADLPFDASTVNEYIDQFIKETPLKFNELEKLREEGKFDAFRDIAHSITNVAGHLGAHSLARATKNLEKSSPSYLASEDGARTVRGLRPIFNQTCDALNAYAKASGG